MTLVKVRPSFFLQVINSSLYTIDIINGELYEDYVGEVNDVPEELLVDYYNNLEVGVR